MMNLGDNFVTGDNIYLRELQNFFFEVLGMMSITHYGAIGDGRTDNYGPLQVAIDDAKRRGLSYLYVPYGRFIYTGELINLYDPETEEQTITFVGNPHSKIVNIRTGEEIPIIQFGVGGAGTSNYEDLSNKPKINSVELSGSKSLDDLGIQGKLTPGSNISIINNVISATGGGGASVTNLTSDLVLTDTMPQLSTGFYYTDTHTISANSTTVFGPRETVYYDATTFTFAGALQFVYYDVQLLSWQFVDNSRIESILTNSSDKIPASSAVYAAIQGGGGGGGTQDVIGLRLRADFTGSKTTGIPLTAVTNIGTSFALSSDGIYITVGTGVNYIDASFGMCFTKAADGATNYIVSLKVKRGDNTLFLTKTKDKIDTAGDHSIQHASQIIAVQPGDRIYLNSVGFASGDTTISAIDSSYVTYLTIKKVG